MLQESPPLNFPVPDQEVSLPDVPSPATYEGQSDPYDWVRVRVVGTVALEPLTRGQGQPFAVWHKSKLGYVVTTGVGKPPADGPLASDVTYVTIKPSDIPLER